MVQRDNCYVQGGMMPNITLHTVVLILLYLNPQAPNHNGVADVGAITGLAGGVL